LASSRYEAPEVSGGQGTGKEEKMQQAGGAVRAL